MCGFTFESHAACRASTPRSDSHSKSRTPPVEFQVPGRAEMLALIRSRVADFARSMPFSNEEIEDIKLAVGEASANAIRHGAAAPSCKVCIKMEKKPNCLKVSIADQGYGFDPASVPVPPHDSLDENGRGIMLMRALVDEVKFRFARPGITVELIKRVKRHYC